MRPTATAAVRPTATAAVAVGTGLGPATTADEPTIFVTAQRRGWWAAGALALYGLLAIGVFWHVWTGHPAAQTVGKPDAYMESWFLGFIAQAVLHGHNPFYTAAANYPSGINVLDNTSQPLLGLVGMPVTLAFGPLATFNLWLTAGLALSAWSAYFLVRRFVAWPPAAVLAGLVYGFSPYMIAHSSLGHLNLVFVPIPPLIFLVLHDLLVARRDRWVRNGLLLAVLAVIQFFVSEEVLVTTVLVAAVVMVVAALVGRRTLRAGISPPARGLGLAAVCASAALAYPVWFVLCGPEHIVGPIQRFVQAFRADLLGPVLPNQFERLAPPQLVRISQPFASSIHENGSYLGVPLILLVVVGVVWLRRERAVQVVATTGLVAFVLSLGGALTVTGAPTYTAAGAAAGGIPLPEGLLAKIGPLQNIVPARISLYVALAAAFLLGIVLDRARLAWSRRWGRGPSAVRTVALALAALVPLVPVVPFTGLANPQTPAFFTDGSHGRIPPGSVALVYPYPSELFAQAQAWQELAGVPFEMPGGYFLVPGANGRIAFTPTLFNSRPTPLAHELYAVQLGHPPPMTLAWRARVRDQLARIHVRTVIAVPRDEPDPPRSLAYLEWLLGPPSARQGGTVDWYGLHFG